MNHWKTVPIAIDVIAGEQYAWCSCGFSQTLPLCDKSHKQQNKFKPIKFVAEKTQRLYLCGCGLTKSAPHCDGSHLTLNTDNPR